MRKTKATIILMILIAITVIHASVAAENKRVYSLEIYTEENTHQIMPGIEIQLQVRSAPDEITASDVYWYLWKEDETPADEIAMITEDGKLNIKDTAEDGTWIIIEASFINQWQNMINAKYQVKVKNEKPKTTEKTEIEEIKTENLTWDEEIPLRSNDPQLRDVNISGRNVSTKENYYILYANRPDITWHISDESIAIFSEPPIYTASITFIDEGDITVTAVSNDGKAGASVKIHRYCPIDNISLYRLTEIQSGEDTDIYGYVLTHWKDVKGLREKEIEWTATVNGKETEKVSIKKGKMNDIYPGFISAALSTEELPVGTEITVTARSVDEPEKYAEIKIPVTEKGIKQTNREEEPFKKRIHCREYEESKEKGEHICNDWIEFSEFAEQVYSRRYDLTGINSFSDCPESTFEPVTAESCEGDKCEYIEAISWECKPITHG